MAKHMKQNSKRPERVKRANRVDLPMEAQEPAWELQRDKAFREELAREYGVEQPPRKFQRTFARTLESLPDEMPVRHRPVIHFLRSAATVAAVLATTFAALLGLNTTYPQLTEALPGLGPVFAAMNGGRTNIQPPDQEATPEPAPTPVPEFQPETVLSKSDFPGVLTIDDAWSDGESLIIDMSISPYGELSERMEMLKQICADEWRTDEWMVSSLRPAYLSVPDVGGEKIAGAFDDGAVGEPDYGYDGDGYETVYSASLELSSGGKPVPYTAEEWAFDFHPDSLDSQGRFRARWQGELPEPVSGEISARIAMPDMLFMSGVTDVEEARVCWKAGFEAEFTVPVSGGKRQFQVNAADGSTTLGTVTYAPSRVELDVTLPWLGLTGDMCLDYIAPDGLLGCNAMLTSMDGSYVYQMSDMVCPEEEEIQAGKIPNEFHIHYTFMIQSFADGPHPKDLTGPLVLTLYELPEEAEFLAARRVSAEFTIDPTTGRAYASENYLKEGREKADTSLTATQRLDSLANDGILCWDGFKREDDGTVYFQIMQRLGTISHAMLVVNAYSEGELVKEFVFDPQVGQYDDDDAVSSPSYYESPSGQEYLVTSVWLGWPASDYDSGQLPYMDRIEIVDYETGEVLVKDVEFTYLDTWAQLIGGTAPTS